MFKPQFAGKVKDGSKRQTVRPVPKGRRPQVGDLESWREWSGRPYWSEHRELARVKLTAVNDITITANEVRLGDNVLIEDEEHDFAQADGFGGFVELAAWFKAEHGLPFSGILIQAKDE